LLQKIYELGYATTSQRNAVESAEVAIEAQRVTIEVLQKLCRLYEDVLGSQRAMIELLKKICRLYEDEVDGLLDSHLSNIKRKFGVTRNDILSD